MAPVIKQSLRLLTEEQIVKAVASGQEDNLILQELSALVRAYINEGFALAAQGRNPSLLFRENAKCPLEKIAAGMAAASFKAEQLKNERV